MVLGLLLGGNAGFTKTITDSFGNIIPQKDDNKYPAKVFKKNNMYILLDAYDSQGLLGNTGNKNIRANWNNTVIDHCSSQRKNAYHFYISGGLGKNWNDMYNITDKKRKKVSKQYYRYFCATDYSEALNLFQDKLNDPEVETISTYWEYAPSKTYNEYIYKMNLQRKFGIVLKELRLEKGLSQESLANQSEIDRTYISDIEKGERNISLKIIERLSETLQISLSELFKKIEEYGKHK